MSECQNTTDCGININCNSASCQPILSDDVALRPNMGLYFFRVAGQEGLSTGYDSQV